MSKRHANTREAGDGDGDDDADATASPSPAKRRRTSLGAVASERRGRVAEAVGAAAENRTRLYARESPACRAPIPNELADLPPAVSSSSASSASSSSWAPDLMLQWARVTELDGERHEEWHRWYPIASSSVLLAWKALQRRMRAYNRRAFDNHWTCARHALDRTRRGLHPLTRTPLGPVFLLCRLKYGRNYTLALSNADFSEFHVTLHSDAEMQHAIAAHPTAIGAPPPPPPLGTYRRAVAYASALDLPQEEEDAMDRATAMRIREHVDALDALETLQTRAECDALASGKRDVWRRYVFRMAMPSCHGPKHRRFQTCPLDAEQILRLSNLQQTPWRRLACVFRRGLVL